MPTSRSYHAELIKSLQDPQEAAAYLDAVLEDCTYDELVLALSNVSEARFAIAKNLPANSPQDTAESARWSTTDRRSSPQTSLDLAALQQTLGELGFRLSVTPTESAA
jgi:DNA-binding phage protein